MQNIQLIVGLGNIGAEYTFTRHNAGFWWVDAVSAASNSQLSLETKFYGVAGLLKNTAQKTYLLKPNTFMNASGRAVAAMANFYKISPSQILVVHDELDLPVGRAKLKKGGGHGGHNGLRDIASALGTPDFWRLRLGIGHPGDKNAVVNFVLKVPLKEEMRLIEEAVDNSLRVLPLLLDGKFDEAMLQLHTK